MIHSIRALEGLSGDCAEGREIVVEGWMSPFDRADRHGYFALVDAPSCCFGCLPQAVDRRVEVFMDTPLPVTGQRLRLAGRLHRLEDDPADWRWQLHDARLAAPILSAAGFGRRAFATGALTCLAVGAQAQAIPETQARAALAGRVTIDIHTHAGGVNGVRRVETNAPFSPVAGPMREGGMAILCLAAVSDSPTQKVMPDRRIRPFRDPAPGELYEFTNRALQRLHALAASQGLPIVRDAAGLAACRADRPGIVVSCEGADFLEGRIARVAEAHGRWALRHLQLTHYRVNELGDIQTEAPVHGGLTAFGAEVIRECNRLGIVVDVAHGTFDLVRRAAEVTRKPLVLSHSSLASAPGPQSRQISPSHARAVAGTGGVIGIWPPASIFPDKAALAAGMARMVDVVGIDHVALGSDMGGLVGASSFAGYGELPALAGALLARGFHADEVGKLLGGNYLRVFTASLA